MATPELNNQRRIYKIVVMGGGGVGKSCLTMRLILGQFVDRYDPTIEDSYRKDNFRVDDVQRPIEIMDTAGQDSFMPMRDIYYRSGDGFILVYSVTDASSIEDVRQRFRDLVRVRCDPSFADEECPPVTLVGNKCDLEKIISTEEGQAIANEMHATKVDFIETSAKTNLNVEKVFQDIVRRVVEEVAQKEAQEAERERQKNKGKMFKCQLL